MYAYPLLGTTCALMAARSSISDVSASRNDVQAPSDGGGQGILIQTFGSDDSSVDTDDNTVDGYDNGIYVNIDTQDSAEYRARGNVVSGTGENGGHGILFNGFANDDVSIEIGGEDAGNDVSDHDGDGIRIFSSRVVGGTGDTSIVDNTVTNTNDAAVYYEAIPDSGSTQDADISGNVIDDADIGFFLTSPMMDGLDVSSNAENSVTDVNEEVCTNDEVNGTIDINGNAVTLPNVCP